MTLPKLFRRFAPHRTDSIDEFVNKVKEYHGKTIVAKIGHTHIVASKGKRKYDIFSAKIVASTEYGTQVIFKKEYIGNGDAMMSNISYAINGTSKIPNITSIIKNSQGKELKSHQYMMIREYPEQVALMKAYLEDKS